MDENKIFQFADGELILVDKPYGWTSFDVVNHIRVTIKKHLGIAKLKVGHAGTLDPLATGLLILCTGKMTKQIQLLQDQEKVYTGTMRMGITTPSYDLETETDAVFATEHIDAEMIESARLQFIGEIQQMPPIYSAVKIDGKRAFNYARKQMDVQLTTRTIHISSFDIEADTFPDVHFTVKCSKGTYIRSLVHDFGKTLGSGAVMTSLRRTQSGHYTVENAWALEDLKKAIQQMPKES